MGTNERIFWILLSCLLMFLFFQEKSELDRINHWVQRQNDELLILDSLLTQDFVPPSNDSINYHTGDWIFEYELNYLLENGLSDPINQLKQDLINRIDLIPVEGVFGGTMRIYSPEQIRILPGRYVYAVFEDGHIQGNLILQYEVKESQISWKIIDSSLF